MMMSWDAGLKVQTWTEVYRFDSYCPGKCEPQGPSGPLDFMTTLNIEHITVPGTDLTWSTKKKACKKCVSSLNHGFYIAICRQLCTPCGAKRYTEVP